MTDSRMHDSHDLQLLANPTVWLCALAAAFTVGTARAATSPDDLQAPSNASSMSPKQAYEHDKAFCNSGQSTQPRAQCLKEAERAYRESRAGRLDDGVVAQVDDNSRSSAASSGSSLGTTSTSGTNSDASSDTASTTSNGRAARSDRH